MRNNTDINQEIIETAKKIINDEIDPIKGARFIVDNRFELETHVDEKLYDFLIAFVSETELMPIEENRKRYSKAYLLRMNEEKEGYFLKVLEKVKKSCHNLIDAIEK